MSWFKLVGSTENPLPDNWVADLPELLTEMRFPWNKPPSDIWAPGHLILYAVGAGTLIGIQQVDGPRQLRPRRGVPGSVENRWPYKLAVKTEVVCSPVSAAQKLREVAPKIAARYGKRFWNGSTGSSTTANTSSSRQSFARLVHLSASANERSDELGRTPCRPRRSGGALLTCSSGTLPEGQLGYAALRVWASRR